MIIRAAVTHKIFKIYANITKKLFAMFSHAYQHNHDAMALKFIANTIQWL